MKRKTWAGIALLGFAGVFVAARLFSIAFTEVFGHSEEAIRWAKRDLSVIRRMKRVDAVFISLDVAQRGPSVMLEPPEDNAHIDALMRSLRRVTVMSTTYGWPDRDAVDEIRVVSEARGGGNISIEGRFDPGRAPVVSSILRSDDLGKVVYSIFKAKGVRWPSDRDPVPR